MVGPAHAVATVAADTTRSPAGDPLAAGRSTSLNAGGGDRTLLRFAVRGLSGPPARAVLRLRVTAPTIESLAVRAIAPTFGEDDGTPADPAPAPTVIGSVAGASAGTPGELLIPRERGRAAVGGEDLQAQGAQADDRQGQTRTVRLTLLASARTAIRRAQRAGRRIAVTFRVRITDGAGDTRTMSRRIALRR